LMLAVLLGFTQPAPMKTAERENIFSKRPFSASTAVKRCGLRLSSESRGR
jgi:hypothetical protein